MELDREDFRLWLAAKEPDEVVGDRSNCPIASYLGDLTGREWAVAGNLCFPVPGPAQIGPKWQTHFTGPIDDLPGVRDNEMRLDWSPVTAKQALTILDSI